MTCITETQLSWKIIFLSSSKYYLSICLSIPPFFFSSLSSCVQLCRWLTAAAVTLTSCPSHHFGGWWGILSSYLPSYWHGCRESPECVFSFHFPSHDIWCVNILGKGERSHISCETPRCWKSSISPWLLFLLVRFPLTARWCAAFTHSYPYSAETFLHRRLVCLIHNTTMYRTHWFFFSAMRRLLT